MPFGLKATGSHLISVEDVFVSDEMTFSIYNHKNHYVDPIYQFPFIPFSEASFAAVVLRMANILWKQRKIWQKEIRIIGE